MAQNELQGLGCRHGSSVDGCWALQSLHEKMMALAKEAIDSHSLLKNMLPECTSSRMLLVRHGGEGRVKIPKMMNASLGFVVLLHDTSSSSCAGEELKPYGIASSSSSSSYSTQFCSGSSTRVDMDNAPLQLLVCMSTGRQYLEIECVPGAAISAAQPWIAASLWFFDESNLRSKAVADIEAKFPTTIRGPPPTFD
jgi:hypothetical protein